MPYDPFAQDLGDPCEHYLSGPMPYISSMRVSCNRVPMETAKICEFIYLVWLYVSLRHEVQCGSPKPLRVLAWVRPRDLPEAMLPARLSICLCLQFLAGVVAHICTDQFICSIETHVPEKQGRNPQCGIRAPGACHCHHRDLKRRSSHALPACCAGVLDGLRLAVSHCKVEPLAHAGEARQLRQAGASTQRPSRAPSRTSSASEEDLSRGRHASWQELPPELIALIFQRASVRERKLCASRPQTLCSMSHMNHLCDRSVSVPVCVACSYAHLLPLGAHIFGILGNVPSEWNNPLSKDMHHC